MASVIRPNLLRQTALLSGASTRQAAAAATPARAAGLTSALLSQQLPVRSAATKDAVRVAAFHASSRRSLLPPGPQVIKGTVNDPVPVPDPSPIHGSYHWTFERAVAAGLVPLTLAPFAAGSLNPGMDAIFCAFMLVHSHTGLQQIVIDYVPNSRFPGLRKASNWALNAVTVLVAVGLYEFETNDVGVTETIKRVWQA